MFRTVTCTGQCFATESRGVVRDRKAPAYEDVSQLDVDLPISFNLLIPSR